MTDHWQAISGAVAAVIVGSMAIMTRHLFVMKRDCREHRTLCNQTICNKLDLLRLQAATTANGAVTIDKESKETLKDINAAILTISKDLSNLEGAFDRFLHEFDKIKKE